MKVYVLKCEGIYIQFLEMLVYNIANVNLGAIIL
jgi:hypothetical protein